MLPYLQSYNDPKIEKAYRRYLAGESQRKIAKALKIPQRSLARYCKNDGWEAERKARSVTDEAPTVAAVAAEGSSVAAPAATPAPQTPSPDAAPAEPRTVRMERMLERQQRITGRLVTAFEADVDRTLAATSDGKPLSRSQIAQLSHLGNNLMAMERKAWGVPDKIETKDTTPPKADPIREMTDDQLQRRERELEQQLAAAEGREGPDRGGEAPKESVN